MCTFTKQIVFTSVPTFVLTKVWVCLTIEGSLTNENEKSLYENLNNWLVGTHLLYVHTNIKIHACKIIYWWINNRLNRASEGTLSCRAAVSFGPQIAWLLVLLEKTLNPGTICTTVSISTGYAVGAILIPLMTDFKSRYFLAVTS